MFKGSTQNKHFQGPFQSIARPGLDSTNDLDKMGGGSTWGTTIFE